MGSFVLPRNGTRDEQQSVKLHRQTGLNELLMNLRFSLLAAAAVLASPIAFGQDILNTQFLRISRDNRTVPALVEQPILTTLDVLRTPADFSLDSLNVSSSVLDSRIPGQNGLFFKFDLYNGSGKTYTSMTLDGLEAYSFNESPNGNFESLYVGQYRSFVFGSQALVPFVGASETRRLGSELLSINLDLADDTGASALFPQSNTTSLYIYAPKAEWWDVRQGTATATDGSVTTFSYLAPVPEPGLMIAGGAAALLAWRRKRKASK